MVDLTEQLEKYLRRYPLETAPPKCLVFIQSQPDCFNRRCFQNGHFTASAWVVNSNHDKFLLTHHRKIGKWMQLGGHVEQSRDLLAEAMREVKEESGLPSSPLSLDIFDIDIHQVPAFQNDPAHLHYDLRYLLLADEKHPLLRTSESNELRWIDRHEIGNLTQEESVIKMVRKYELYRVN